MLSYVLATIAALFFTYLRIKSKVRLMLMPLEGLQKLRQNGGIGLPHEIHLILINVIPWPKMCIRITAPKL